jgi:hypothetical protein
LTSIEAGNPLLPLKARPVDELEEGGPKVLASSAEDSQTNREDIPGGTPWFEGGDNVQ